MEFIGWEAEHVVAVIVGGGPALEMVTRAKTHLVVIIVDAGREDFKEYYAEKTKYFNDAADNRLVELFTWR